MLRTRSRFSVTTCGAVAAVALATGATRASPVDLFGFGARGQGLAGAIGATAEGFESVYYNPAGLAFDRRPTFALGYQVGTFDLRFGVGDDKLAESKTRDAPALSIGFGVPIPFGGVLAHRIALGLGFVIPQTSILIADIARPGDPTFLLVENRAQTVSVQAALSVRIADWLAVGVGTIALAALDGHIQVAPNAAGRLGTQVRDALVADYALVAGVLGRLLPRTAPTARDAQRELYGLSWALTYRGRSEAEFNLPIDADLGSSFGIPIPQIMVHGIAQFDPAEAALELAARPIDALTVSLGAKWEGWSAFPKPIEYAAVPEGTPPQPLPRFHDTVAVKAGVEGDVPLGPDVSLRPRVGFAYEPTPVPEQTGFHNHLDSDRAIFALGLGVRWGHVRLDLAGQVQDLAQRKSVKAADTPDTNLGFPSITSTGHILFGAIEIGVEL